MQKVASELTTEQRVLASLRCEQADRVPVFIYLNPYVDYEWYSKDPSYADLLQDCRRYADVIYDWCLVPFWVVSHICINRAGISYIG